MEFVPLPPFHVVFYDESGYIDDKMLMDCPTNLAILLLLVAITMYMFKTSFYFIRVGSVKHN